MSFADANRSSIRILEESAWGTTPTSGRSREVRLTSSSLSAQKETVVSDELRSDRMVGSITEVSAMSSGDINFEFSAGATDEFLAAFVMGAWSRPMTIDFWKGKTVSITANDTITLAGADYTGYLTVGRRIKTDGFLDPINNNYWVISAVDFLGGNTEIQIGSAVLTPEVGTFRSAVYDANDVIILKNVAISATADGFDANGTDSFATAIAAGNLVTGQQIAVSGIGIETGDVTVSGALTTLALTVSDGVTEATLTAGTDFAVGGTASADAAALATAINQLRLKSANPVEVKAEAAAGIVTVTNLKRAGGALTESTADGAATITDFAGGVAGATGVFTVTAVTDDFISVLPKPSPAPAQKITIKGSMLRNPSGFAEIAQRQFTIETGYNDISQYMVQDGMVPGTFSLEIATGSIITGTIGFEGRSTALRQSTLLAAAPYTVLTSTPGEVVNATTDVGSVGKNGADFGACIQSLSLSGEANLRQQACVGSKFARGIGAGRFNLTGSMSVFFEDEDLFADFINHETVSLNFSIIDADGYAYYWTIPAAKFSQDEIAPGGIDQDVIESIEFTAFRDPTTQCMVQIDRFSPNSEV